MLDPLLEPEFAVSDRSEHYRPQNYRTEWQDNPLFKDWITKGVSSKRARCKVCDIEMTADICVLKSHGRGIKHLRRLRGDIPESDLKGKCATYNPKWEAEEEYKGWLQPGRVPFKAECKLCDVEFRAEKTVLRNHAKSRRHQRSESHARRVREAAQLWAAERSPPPIRLPSRGRLHNASDSDSGDPGSQPENSPGDRPSAEELLAQRLLAKERLADRLLPKQELTERTAMSEKEFIERPILSEEQLTKRLTSFIVNGYQRLRAKCPDCQSPLLRDKAGTRLCVACTSDIPVDLDDHLSDDDAEDEPLTDAPASPTPTPEDSNDFFPQGSINNFDEQKMEIEIEGKPCIFSDDEDSFTLFRMVHDDGESEEEASKCVIQGQDMTTEVRQLVQTLLESVASLSVQVSTGHDAQLALARLDKIVGLLNKVKAL